MSTILSESTELMTSDKLFKMRPSKTVDRWIFRGELKEDKVTLRSPDHARTYINMGFLLEQWRRGQQSPVGVLYGADVFFRIRKDPETNIGIDLALTTPSQATTIRKNAKYIDGAPSLAIEILAPTDKLADVHEKLDEYLDCGTAAVWIVNPYLGTVQIHRNNQEPITLNRSETIENQPELPGFSCTVAEFFA